MRRWSADRPVRLVAFLELEQELLAPRVRAAEQALWLLVRAARLLAAASPRGACSCSRPACPITRWCTAAVDADPLVAGAERPSRSALGFPPFGGLAELSGDAPAVGRVRAGCRVPAPARHLVVLGPVDDGGSGRWSGRPRFASWATRSARPEVDAGACASGGCGSTSIRRRV